MSSTDITEAGPAQGRAHGRGDRVQRAYERLRELIIWGRLAPGSRIIETDIATRLNVSRTPVRSALQRLLQEGFVISSDNGPQQRLSVAPMTLEDANELFTILGELEALAVIRVAGRPAAERAPVVAEMRRANAALSQTSQRPDADSQLFFDLDRAFHITFFKAGSGPRLQTLVNAVKPQSERYARLYMSALTDQIHKSVTEHDAIIAAVDAGDPVAAKAALLANWQSAAQRLSHVIERLGERGIW